MRPQKEITRAFPVIIGLRPTFRVPVLFLQRNSPRDADAEESTVQSGSGHLVVKDLLQHLTETAHDQATTCAYRHPRAWTTACSYANSPDLACCISLSLCLAC